MNLIFLKCGMKVFVKDYIKRLEIIFIDHDNETFKFKNENQQEVEKPLSHIIITVKCNNRQCEFLCKHSVEHGYSEYCKNVCEHHPESVCVPIISITPSFRG